MTTATAVAAGPVEYIKTIGLTTNQSGRGFTNPYDCAFDANGRILTLNRCDTVRASLVRIGMMSWEEDYLGEFSRGYGRGDGQWILPVAMALDGQGVVYVTDEQQHRLTALDTDGNFVRQWGEPGSDAGQLNGPAGLAIGADETLYVVEQGNNRVQRFTTTGESLGTWGEAGDGPGQFNMPWGVGLDAAGNVYVADWRNDRVQKFTADGQFIAAYGSSGDGDGQLSRPSAVCVDSAGYIYVADWGQRAGADIRRRRRLCPVAAGAGHAVQVGAGLYVRQSRRAQHPRNVQPGAGAAGPPGYAIPDFIPD